MGTLNLPRKVSVLLHGIDRDVDLDLFEQAGVDIEMIGLTAGRNVARLAEQSLRWQVAVIQDEALLPELRERLKGSGIRAEAGARRSSTWPGRRPVGDVGDRGLCACPDAGRRPGRGRGGARQQGGPGLRRASLLRMAKLAGGR